MKLFDKATPKVVILLLALAANSVLCSSAMAQQVYKGMVTARPNTVSLGGEELFSIAAPAGGFSAAERAIMVDRNIANALVGTTGVCPDSVDIVTINNLPVIRIGGKHVVTVDSSSAKAAGMGLAALAQSWSDSIKHALSDSNKIQSYVASLSGSYLPAGPGISHRLAQYEAARLNRAADEFAITAGCTKTSAAFERLGMDALLARDYDKAVCSFKSSLELEKANAMSHYGLGLAYMKEGHLDAAVKELEMGRWLEPGNALIHIALAESYQALGLDNMALRNYQEAVRLQPDNPQPYLAIADIREARNDMRTSVEELAAGVMTMPNSAYLRLRQKEQLTWRLQRPY